MTVNSCSAEFPESSATVTMMVFSPSSRVIGAEKLPLESALSSVSLTKTSALATVFPEMVIVGELTSDLSLGETTVKGI